MKRVVVTGASGVAGRAVVGELLEHGYQVLATDLLASRDRGVRADLTDYGQASEVLRGAEAVVHLANIPAAGVATPPLTFERNLTINFNVFHAAVTWGLHRVVWASSEMTLGLPFGLSPQEAPYVEVGGEPPRYAPVDEDHYPIPTNTYALSKIASEAIAPHLARWSGMPIVALRLSNIRSPDAYAEFRSFWADPQLRKWNLWGYVDIRDVARSCRLALEAPAEAVVGSPSFIIAAADTVMDRPSSELLREVFPEVPIIRQLGEFETLLSIDRARSALGYQPQHSWRDHLSSR